jgi:hypothetical protein
MALTVRNQPRTYLFFMDMFFTMLLIRARGEDTPNSTFSVTMYEYVYVNTVQLKFVRTAPVQYLQLACFRDLVQSFVRYTRDK